MNNRPVLVTLCELASNQADNAARQLGQLQSAQQQALNQQQLLTGYYQDYQQYLHQKIQPGMPVGHWDDYQQFLPAVQQAISLQQQAIQQGEQYIASALAYWQSKKQRLNALQTLLHRHQQRLNAQQQRQQQKLTDEFSARRFHGAQSCRS
ncbi:MULTISPECIES: flagellar export protein FliJ [unclassified Tatumella]|uniref:flagellar export protein FliJ n=1 Tax=unclassified Tatumella TaxID=2649542 RepID=UPI001BB06A45|nr:MULTISPECIES: flagellar export protein FliJ [unclassified Tatumella]MBS0856702.1 flagellar export protein FliJ [Tatumella sp. JGM16]MBS0878041.1 flagellar export protein FliJ [Tatumella sp. JGM82]MBS0891236.1 flagellar export protein FliJ [Tatumella sp. JGM94]MBS0902615.1 flagellar export protein FliJ [Tatumella sp. JGM100]MBS0912916.1 flagellar export protein FliJ [Tatumella sp. JGM91]